MTPVRKPTRWEWLAIGWLFGVLALCVVIGPVSEQRPFHGPLMIAFVACGLIWISAMIAMLATRAWRAAGFLAVLTALASFMGPVASIVATNAWRQFNFDRSKATYAEIIARRERLPDEGRLNGVAYRIERGSPDRIAFLLPIAEIDDNWTAVVHDPSDAVATPRDEDGRPGVRPGMAKLWGGDLQVCEPIVDHYYRCGFYWRESTARWPQRWRPRGPAAP